MFPGISQKARNVAVVIQVPLSTDSNSNTPWSCVGVHPCIQLSSALQIVNQNPPRELRITRLVFKRHKLLRTNYNNYASRSLTGILLKAPGIVRVVLFNKTFPRPWIKFVLMMNLPTVATPGGEESAGGTARARYTTTQPGVKGSHAAHRTCASLCTRSAVPNCETNVPSHLNLYYFY